MVSEAKGIIYVPVWVDDGVVKALVSNDGTIPTTESTPMTDIQARLYGERAGQWLPIRSTSDNQLMMFIAGQAGDLEVQQQAPADMQVGAHGYDGSNWKKQGMIWSYYDLWVDKKTVVSTGDAETSVWPVQAPSGYVYKLEGWNVTHTDDVARAVRIQLYVPTYTQVIYVNDAMPGDTLIYGSSNFTLRFQCNIWFIVTGLASGKSATIEVWGTKMRVNM